MSAAIKSPSSNSQALVIYSPTQLPDVFLYSELDRIESEAYRTIFEHAKYVNLHLRTFEQNRISVFLDPIAGKTSSIKQLIMKHSNILREEPKSHQIIKCFIKELTLEHSCNLNTYYFKPALGCNGFTFLCQTGPNDTKFVLKWVKKDQAEIEKFCSTILKKFQFITPDIELIDFAIWKNLIPFMSKINPNVEFIDDSYTLIFMLEFQGITLSDMITDDQINTFNVTKWKEFFDFCGRISIIDCFMANDDRLIRFNPSNLSKNKRFLSYSMNSGNLMISDNNDHFFVIDNSTSCFKRIKKEDDSKEQNLALCSLFNNNQNSSLEAPLLNDSFSAETIEKGKDIVDIYHEIFNHFSKKENYEEFAKAIIQAFKKEFEEKSKAQIFDFNQFKKNILTGIEKGLDQITKFVLPLSSTNELCFSCKECYSLMEKNILKLMEKSCT